MKKTRAIPKRLRSVPRHVWAAYLAAHYEAQRDFSMERARANKLPNVRAILASTARQAHHCYLRYLREVSPA